MRTVALIVVASLVCSSCVAGMTTLPDDYSPETHGPPECTARRGAPAAQGAIGASLLGLFTAAALDDSDGEFDEVLLMFVGLVLIPPGVVASVSSVRGFRAASECRRAREDYLEYWQEVYLPEHHPGRAPEAETD